MLDKNQFQMKTLLEFATVNPDKVLLTKFQDKEILIISPFIYLLHHFNFDELELLKEKYPKHYFIPQIENQEYYKKNLSKNLKIQTRAQFQKINFNESRLTNLVSGLDQSFWLDIINAKDFDEIKLNPAFKSHLFHYKSFDDFKDLGLAVCLKENNEILCVVSSFIHTHTEYEIQVNTLKNHRQKCYAKITCAKFLIECQRLKMIPRWDAATEKSRNLGLKLGFSEEVNYIMIF